MIIYKITGSKLSVCIYITITLKRKFVFAVLSIVHFVLGNNLGLFIIHQVRQKQSVIIPKATISQVSNQLLIQGRRR